MEKYIDMENNALNATAGTAEGQEHEAMYQIQQKVRQLGVGAKKIKLVNLGVFKATSENRKKRFKTRQESTN